MNTQDSRLKVLLVEDNPGDFRLIQEMFKESGANVELKWAKQLSTGLANLKEENFDGLLVDLGLPDSQGIDTFKKIHDQAPQIPIVVITGLADDGLAMRAVREGAQDYLVKGQMDSNLLIRAIRHAIERKRAEEVLRSEREKLEMVTQNMGAGLALISKDYHTLWANNVLKQIFGDVEGKTCYSIYNQRAEICPRCGVREVFEKGSEKVVHEQVGKDIEGKHNLVRNHCHPN